ncbi:MAG TPA: phosphoenolpyruvate synthase, partial [Nannocystis sp.]
MMNTTDAMVVRADVIGLHEVDRTRASLVGGKGANLGELARIAGVRVPAGFCVTTGAFARVVAGTPAVHGMLDRLASLTAQDRDGIRELGGELRRIIEATAIPDDLETAIARMLSRLGADETYAVRSSATAEDLPGASFAGQQDTYLEIRGTPAILGHVRRCWASLFSDRAVAYRIQHGFDHRKILMAVVIQKMVRAQAAGILFTADPVTSNRKVTSIEAGLGLGEALVAGLARADRYRVRDGQIVEKAVASEALTEAQVLRLERLGRQIEAHFGEPQDVEWCLFEGEFDVVQSRPITTLYPIPGADDGDNRVYISVGHQQMMTDAMKPLGLSLFRLSSGGHMHAAGGRLFVDATKQLASPTSRDALLGLMARSDPLTRDALLQILERADFLKVSPEAPRQGAGRFDVHVDDDPAIVAELIDHSQAEIEALRREIRTKTGTALFDFISEDILRLKQSLFAPRSMGVIMAGMNALWWINEQMLAWLGEKNVGDTLSQSVANNVTSEMGLALLDVADVIRPYPDVVAFLQHVKHDGFLDEMVALEGGQQARDAIRAYLDKYGMRCVGEIDITRARWSERPTTLVPAILNNVKNVEAGAGARRFAQ